MAAWWLVLLLAVAAAFVYPYLSPALLASSGAASGTGREEDLPSFTLQDVALHNTSSDLWLVIGTGVYNMTEFYPKHPGRDEMLRGAGKDATALFSGHSAIAKALKKTYLIGRLRREGETKPLARNLWEVEARFLNGSAAPFSLWKGKVVLIVNLASECGYTPQYPDLQALHARYAYAGLRGALLIDGSERGFTIVGVPSNDFGGQEPGDAAQIQAFAAQYGVTFPILEKASLAASPLYHFLSVSLGAPEWNFYKYFVGRDGSVKRRFPSEVAPLSDPIVRVVEYLLRQPATTDE